MSMRLLLDYGLGHFQTFYAANDPGDKTVTAADANFETPDDARGGVRLITSGRVQKGIGVNGASISYANSGQYVTPLTNFDSTLFEYKWEEINAADAGSTDTPPIAVSTFGDIDGTKAWTLTTTTSGVKDWIIDITVREKADVTNTATFRVTINVEVVV